MTTNIDQSLVDIDPNALDQEWLSQPRKVMRYSTLLADAKNELAEAKAELDVVAAEVDKHVRLCPSDFGMEKLKLTEAIVSNTVLLDKRHRDALKQVNNARYKVDLLQAACDALEHRKKALENLVTLFLQSYWSEPIAKGPSAKDKIDDLQRRAHAAKHKLEITRQD